MESSEFDTSLVNRQSGPEARILVCVKRSGVFLRSTKRRNTRLGLCSQGHSFVSLRITKVCFTAPNWLKVQEKACALAYRITRSIVVETFRFTYVHTHFLLFRIRLPSFPSPYQIPNLVAELPSSRFRSLSGLLLLSLTSSIGLRALLSLSTCACQLFCLSIPLHLPEHALPLYCTVTSHHHFEQLAFSRNLALCRTNMKAVAFLCRASPKMFHQAGGHTPIHCLAIVTCYMFG